MKPQIVAKIAAQCADYYQEAYRQMAREVVKALWEKVIALHHSNNLAAFDCVFLGLAESAKRKTVRFPSLGSVSTGFGV